MRKEIVQEVTNTIVTCDFCKTTNTRGVSWPIRQCKICERDVCTKCAILTDCEYLKDNQYSSDYPDFYCKECWEKGEKEREAILDLRKALDEQESHFLTAWRVKCRNMNK